jgi:hypothetical protein
MVDNQQPLADIIHIYCHLLAAYTYEALFGLG